MVLALESIGALLGTAAVLAALLIFVMEKWCDWFYRGTPLSRKWDKRKSR